MMSVVLIVMGIWIMRRILVLIRFVVISGLVSSWWYWFSLIYVCILLLVLCRFC